MDTPKTDALIGNKMNNRTMDEGILIDHARQLERELAAEQEKVKMLREALEKILPKVAHEYQCGTVRPAMHWAEHGSMSFDNCQCEIKSARATMEATKP